MKHVVTGYSEHTETGFISAASDVGNMNRSHLPGDADSVSILHDKESDLVCVSLEQICANGNCRGRDVDAWPVGVALTRYSVLLVSTRLQLEQRL